MSSIPMDPYDVEALPPEDVDVCDRCEGHGTVCIGADPVSGRWVDEQCPACGGSGSRWGWVA